MLLGYRNEYFSSAKMAISKENPDILSGTKYNFKKNIATTLQTAVLSTVIHHIKKKEYLHNIAINYE